MRVTVLLFAGPREAVGRARVEVAVPEGATAERVLDALVAEHPAVARWKGRAVLAVNRAVVGPSSPVREGDEVALLPPVSGGVDARIVEGAFGADDALAALAKDGAGAVVCFLGLVRSPTREGPVTHLDFEAYEAMAAAELRAVAERAKGKFGLVDARIVHRVGRAPAAEPVVLVAVSAAHRREAFDAAQWIMEELKTVVPVWKKEAGPWGERWIEGKPEAPP